MQKSENIFGLADAEARGPAKIGQPAAVRPPSFPLKPRGLLQQALVKPKTFLHVPNRQEKADLSPPRRQVAGRPPIAPKISHNSIHRTWRRRTSAVTFSAYPVRRCEIIGRKR